MTRPRSRTGSELLPVLLILACLAGTWGLIISMHRHATDGRRAVVASPVTTRTRALEIAERPIAPAPPPPPPTRPKRLVEDPTRSALARIGAAEAEQILAARAADRRALALEAARRRATAAADASRRRIGIIRERADSLAMKARHLEQEADLLAMERDVLAHERDATRAALARAKGRASFAVLPHRGPNGTWQRPIMIECRNGTATLQPRGPSFSLMDLSSLLGAGTRSSPIVVAVVRELLRVQGMTGPDGSPSVPYIFFVVRPDGIRPYYAARAQLEPLGIAFGYELVDPNLELDYPDLDHADEWDGSAPLPSMPALARRGTEGPGVGDARSHGQGAGPDDFRWPAHPPAGPDHPDDFGDSPTTANADPSRRNSPFHPPVAMRESSGLAPQGHGDPFLDGPSGPPRGGYIGRGGSPGNGRRPGEGRGGSIGGDLGDGSLPVDGAGGGPPEPFPGLVPGRFGGSPRTLTTPGMPPPTSGPRETSGLQTGGDATDRLEAFPRPPVAEQGPTLEGIEPPPQATDGTGASRGFATGGLGTSTTGGGRNRPAAGSEESGPPPPPAPFPDPDLANQPSRGRRIALPSSNPFGEGEGSEAGNPGDPSGGGTDGVGSQGPRSKRGRRSGRGDGETPPLKIEVPFEIVVACGPDGLVIHPGGYRLSTKAIKGKDPILVKTLDGVVRLRAEVDPLIRPRPKIRFLVEAGGTENYWEARRQTVLSGTNWPMALQVSDLRVLDFLPREAF